MENEQKSSEIKDISPEPVNSEKVKKTKFFSCCCGDKHPNRFLRIFILAAFAILILSFIMAIGRIGHRGRMENRNFRVDKGCSMGIEMNRFNQKEMGNRFFIQGELNNATPGMAYGGTNIQFPPVNSAPVSYISEDIAAALTNTGIVAKIESGKITIKGADNAEKIIVVSDKTIFKGLTADSKLSDLKVDNNISVIGLPGSDNQINAMLVRVLEKK